MKGLFKKAAALACTFALAVSAFATAPAATLPAEAAASSAEWGLMSISGGGFVSGLVYGDSAIYCRTDVGGAYRLENNKWIQLMGFLSEADRGLLCVEAMCVDPTDDDTIYLLCGCNYFSDARTVIFKSTDGGDSFTQADVSSMIKVHGNGMGRHQGERLVVDPNNTDIVYAGGRTGGLIKSTDGGATWTKLAGFDSLGLFDQSIKWPEWTTNMEDTTENGNGISTLYIDENSKLYVGVSVSGKTNVYSSTNGGSSFSALSASLPTNMYIARINDDADGNLLLSYQGGTSFVGSGGGVYRYNITSGAVTDISPCGSSFGQCQSLPNDANTLIATTCAVWSSQSWDSSSTVWGEWLYRSTDGGTTWDIIYPGKMGNWVWNESTGEMSQEQLYDYLDDGGVDWIYGKAIHWSGSLIINPNNTDEILVTSGNGVFKWNDIWSEDPVATFYANGIEEVVALDLCSVPGGDVYSAIGDYDGFIHTSTTSSTQHQPNMGSTCGIAYCADNPDVMIRIPENNSTSAKGYYTLDGGASWTEFGSSGGFGGDCAITKLANGKYRFLVGASSSGAGVNYSDDYGTTWSSASGLSGGKKSMIEVDSDSPQYVYAYSNSPSYSGETTYYYLNVSSDYGATFTAKQVSVNDCCADFRRMTIVDGTVFCPVGWYGMYKSSDHGDSFTKLDSVYYAETVGCGAAKDSSSPLTLYMWGRLNENTVNGIYMSTDLGESWARVNDDLHEYGGPGNGNFVIGDMNEFGTFYMSTVGVGIVYCKSGGSTPTDPDEPKVTLWGDANCDGTVDVRDVAMAAKYASGAKITISDQGLLNIDVKAGGGINVQDVALIAKLAGGLLKQTDMPK